MKKNIAASLLMMSLFGVFAHAVPQTYNEGPNQPMPPKDEGRRLDILSLFQMLSLTPQQANLLEKIITDAQKSAAHPSDAFSTESFDKAKFIEIVQSQKDAKATEEADMIEKAYAILTPDQKSELKTILDMQKIIENKKLQHRGMPSDQNRNDRR